MTYEDGYDEKLKKERSRRFNACILGDTTTE
jgi:hypothetical protein